VTVQNASQIQASADELQITIRKLAQTVVQTVGFSGTLKFNTDMPDGTPRKLLDVSRIEGLGWTAQVPMPAHDLLDIEKYSPILADSAMVASIQTSRGCPGKCTFCDIRQTAYKFRSTENILEEICYLESLGVSEFFIIDDTFTINRKRVFNLCDALIERNLDIQFKISSRVDSVDKEMLEKLNKAGCYRRNSGSGGRRCSKPASE
jgi:hypothetical protein